VCRGSVLGQGLTVERALDMAKLETGYGAAQALNGVDVVVESGEVVSLVGPNGAGKSTLLKTIVGILPIWAGSISLWGRDLKDEPPFVRAGLGVAYVPEGARVFTPLTVVDNLRLGAYLCKDNRVMRQRLDQVLELFPDLQTRLQQKAGSLSGGQRQMLAIGRGLMSAPSLILLDEPSLGLGPLVVADVFDKLRLIKEAGTTILLVEQNATEALEIADRVYVLLEGRVTYTGSASAVSGDEVLRKSYLGL
jgi:branched-chain amino acid transport system ATP-binding protein